MARKPASLPNALATSRRDLVQVVVSARRGVNGPKGETTTTVPLPTLLLLHHHRQPAFSWRKEGSVFGGDLRMLLLVVVRELRPDIINGLAAATVYY